LKVELPSGSGNLVNLGVVARDLSHRLSQMFLPDAAGRRACHGDDARYVSDPNWRDLVLFHEYFHGETGRGLGASHQTGWTALVVKCMEETVRARAESRAEGMPGVSRVTVDREEVDNMLAAREARRT
jgi:hypothetical protein